MLFKIAWSNLKRHGRRSALIILGVAVSVAVMEFLIAVVAGMKTDFYQAMLNDAGHVRVRAAGIEEALDPYSLDYLVSDPSMVMDEARDVDGVESAEKVLTFGALVIGTEKNAPMLGYGVTPGTDYFTGVREGIQQGRFEIDRGQALISTSNAAMLDLTLGDPLVLMVQDSTGAPYYLEYDIGGIFESNSGEFDETAVIIRHADAEELLYVEDSTREIRLTLNDPEESAQVAADMRNALGERNLTVETWQEINGSYIVFMRMFDVFLYVVNVIVVIVAGTVITNAILMNVFEKIREFGTMRAIGLTRGKQFGMVMLEGAVYGVVGSLVGMAVGIPIVLWIQDVGIFFGEMMESFGMSQRLYTEFDLADAIVTYVFGVLVAVVGSLYAGLVASRMRLVETLRESA